MAPFIFRLSYKALLRIAMLFILLSAILGFLLISSEKEQSLSKTETDLTKKGNFDLLSSDIANLNVKDFLELRNDYIISYQPLRDELLSATTDYKGNYGIYFEDLQTGSWVGINERELFIPSSLLKLPIAITIMKLVEDGRISLDKELVLTKEELDSRSGLLYLEGEGYSLTVMKLMELMLKKSDNTAAFVLLRQIPEEDLFDAQESVGILIDRESTEEFLSPKRMANLFRSLYLSNYLRRSSSQYILSILGDTDFNDGIPSGLPEEVKVAHKTGFWLEQQHFHDCGIVYYPNNPYLLCIMTKNNTKAESDLFMGKISNLVYEEISLLKKD